MDEKQMKMAEELLFSGKQKPSFAKALYFGQYEGSRVFPFPGAPDDDIKRVDAFIEKLDKFLKENVDPDKIDREMKIPEDVILGLGKIGLLGMSAPKEYGGLDFSQYGYCRAEEHVARWCGSTALLVNAHQSIGLKALLLYGTDKQKKDHLKDLATGTKIAAFSLTEPNAGSDAAGVETRAEYDPKKKAYILNGRKQWTTNGSIAKVLTVMAQTRVETSSGPEDKITAFLVTPDMPGFKVVDFALDKVGFRGTHTANLAFENMEVPEENIIGKKGRGLQVALNLLNYGRVTFGSTCTGSAKELYERALAHAKVRKQFDRPLASFPLVKEKLATMAAHIYAMDATTYLTAGLLDSGQSDVMLESAILKVFASEAQWQVLYDSMQIMGGRCFFTDQPFERMMRDARLNMIGEGANEVLRAFIGVVGMRDVGLALQAGMEAFKHPFSKFSTAMKFTGRMIGQAVATPDIPVKSSQIKSEARELGRWVRRFGMTIPKLLGKHREGIVEKQLVLDRICEGAIGIYTVTAVLSKLDSDLQRGRCATHDLEVAKLYCKLAFRKMHCSFDTLNKNNDDEIESVSDKLTGVTGSW